MQPDFFFFFFSHFLLTVNNKSLFSVAFWQYLSFLLESLLPVLVRSHQYILLETFRRVRFSALKLQSCTKRSKG